MSSTTSANDSIDELSRRLQASQAEIAARWLERLNALLSVERNQVFPSSHLLDHMPQLIAAIADYVRAPSHEDIAANTGVMAKAIELGTLRYDQSASIHQLLHEYQILADLLAEFVEHQVVEHREPIDAASGLRAMIRIMQAVRVLQQRTVDAFVAKYNETIERQHRELRGFSRLVSHEIRQPLGVLQVLAKIWPVGTEPHAQRMADALGRNVLRLGEVADKLERLARLTRAREDTPVEQEVELSRLVGRVAEQLADMADARDVKVQVAADLPVLLLDPARAELVFVNLVANAIKYADPAKTARAVWVEAGTDPAGAAVRVRDNGIGIPGNRLEAIFKQFVRVHEDRDSELGAQGLGLGLSIVRESMDATGGTIAVESREGDGTVFTLVWPDQRRVQPA